MSKKVSVNGRYSACTKQRQIAAGRLAEGVSIAQALRDAGYAESVALSQPAQTVKPIRELAMQSAQRQHVTVDVFFERLHTRLYSLTSKTIKVVHKNIDADGKVTHVTLDESVAVEDNGAQLRALEITKDIFGLDAPKELKHTGQVTLSIEERRKIQERMWDKLGGIE